MDFTLIKNTWKDYLISHYALNSNLKHMNISDENKDILQHIGLPLIYSPDGYKFIPFTFYQKIQARGKFFYLLGDISSVTMGTHFIGLEISNENIYYISQHQGEELEAEFMNQSLYTFLMCLATYINFIEEIDSFYKSSQKTMQEKYQQLYNNLMIIDHKIMTDIHNYWRHTVYDIYMEIPVIEEEKFEGNHKSEFPQINEDDLPF